MSNKISFIRSYVFKPTHHLQAMKILLVINLFIILHFIECASGIIEVVSNPAGAKFTIYDKKGNEVNSDDYDAYYIRSGQLVRDRDKKTINNYTPRRIFWQEEYDYIKFEMTGYPTQTVKKKVGGKITADFTNSPKTQSAEYGIEQAISIATQQATPRVPLSSVVVVLPPTTTDNILRDFITSETGYILLNQGYRVVDRAQLERIRAEQKLQISGEIDSRTMVSLGKFSGANYILTGRIDYDSGKKTLWIRILDVQTSDIIGTAQVSFGDSQPLSNLISIEDAVQVALDQATSRFTPNSKLAIVNVDAPSSIKDFITGESEYSLVNKAFKVVDRSQLDRIRHEQGFQVSGEVDDKTAVDIGKLAGADYLINIRADGMGGLTRLRWRVLDTGTALLAGTASVPYQGVSSKTPALPIEDALVQAISQAIPRVTKDSRIAILQITSRDTSAREYILGEAGHILVSQGFRVSNRSELDRIRQEQGIQYSGEIDDKTAVDLGKLSGVRYIITGKIDGVDSLLRLRLRILDTETAEVVGVSSVRF